MRALRCTPRRLVLTGPADRLDDRVTSSRPIQLHHRHFDIIMSVRWTAAEKMNSIDRRIQFRCSSFKWPASLRSVCATTFVQRGSMHSLEWRVALWSYVGPILLLVQRPPPPPTPPTPSPLPPPPPPHPHPPPPLPLSRSVPLSIGIHVTWVHAFLMQKHIRLDGFRCVLMRA